VTKAKRIILYRNKCIACGYCISVAPGIWIISRSDGKITSKTTPLNEEETQIIEIENMNYHDFEQSANICPVKSINFF
jgi:ferredoxin